MVGLLIIIMCKWPSWYYLVPVQSKGKREGNQTQPSTKTGPKLRTVLHTQKEEAR